MNYPKVFIIILNFNGWKDTIECLESLYQIIYPNYHIIIVDNCSEDISIKNIKEYCRGKSEEKSIFLKKESSKTNLIEYNYYENKYEKISKLIFGTNKNLILIKNDKNYGFAEGNNIGIRFILDNYNSDYILLLNNDTVVHEKFLSELINMGEKDPRNGIIGPKIYFYNDENLIQATSVKINMKKGTTVIKGLKEADHGQYDMETYGNSVPGACFLIKIGVIESIGLLNKDYFCYWEENEFCIRASKAGYNCIYSPKSIIWHKGSQTSNKLTGFATYYLTRNTFWFEKKYSTSTEYAFFIVYFFIFRFWHQLLNYMLIQKNMKVIICFLKGIFDGLKLKK